MQELTKDNIKLRTGQMYYLTKRIQQDGCVENTEKKMKLVGMYRYHAVFRNEYGYRESFTYPDLRLVLRGVPVNKPWRREY